jgi:FAD:protein FMN transferase
LVGWKHHGNEPHRLSSTASANEPGNRDGFWGWVIFGGLRRFLSACTYDAYGPFAMRRCHELIRVGAILVGVVSCKRGAPSTDAPREVASAAAGATVAESLRTKVSAEAAAMGTRLNFVALTSEKVDEAAVHAAVEKAIEEIRRLEALMTTWKDDSEVSRINQQAGRAPARVSAETIDVISKSLWMSERSGGVFDITFEVMRGLWRFDEDLDRHLPTAAAISERRKLIDFRQIVVDTAQSTVFLRRRDSKISLGGIAKGYAIDRAAKVLLDAGVEDFLAQAGGDLYVHGSRADGSPWMAGIRDPRGAEGSYFARMPVADHAFSTAGDYERSYVVDGKRYHHIIDPRTGWPATASRSVTIWAKDALTADALDDAVFILGPEKGLELVESIDGVGAVIVDGDNRVFVSKRLQGKVTIDRPPTGGV